MSIKQGHLIAFFQRSFEIRAKRQLKELYLFLMLFFFAAELITIFEPIYLFEQGYSLALIALYYAIHYTAYVVVMPLGGMFVSRFGYERSLALSTPLFALHLIVLAGMTSSPMLFWLAPFTLMVHKIFFWPALHAAFATFTDHQNRGTEQSWLRFLLFGTGVLGPLIGGIVATNFGFPILFIGASCVLLFSSIPLLRTAERNNLSPVTYAKVWRTIIAPRHRRMAISMVGWGEDLVHLVFWPVFLFIAFGSTQTVGFAIAGAAILMVAWGFVVGELSDRFGSRTILRFAGPIIAIGYILRMLIQNPLYIAGSLFYERLANISMNIPFMSRLYRSARGSGPLVYSLAFEMVLAISKALLAWVLVAVFLFAPTPLGFTLTFAAAALLALLYGVL